MKQPCAIRLKYFSQLVIIYILIRSGAAFSQHRHFRQFTKEDGLPGSWIYRVCEDEKGYLWMASDKGICRYDGHEFKTYRQAQGFMDAGAFHIFRSRDKSLWFLSLDFNLYHLENDRLVRYLPGIAVAWMDEDNNGNWQAVTRHGEVISFRGHHIISNAVVAPQDIFYACKVVESGILITATGSILHYNAQGVTRLPLEKRTGLTVRYLPLSHNRLLLAHEKGVSVYNGPRKPPEVLLSFTNNEAYCCYEDSVSGDVWLGTRFGAWYFAGGLNKTKKPERFLTGHFVSSIYKSRDGSMWFSTLEGGVYQTSFNVLHYTAEEGLDANGIQYVARRGPFIYSITVSGTASIIRKGEPLRTIDMGAGPVHTIYKNSSGFFALATHAQYVQPAGGKFVRFPIKKPFFLKHITEQDSLYFLNYDGCLYVLRGNKLVSLYDSTQQKFVSRITSGLTDGVLKVLHFDRDGNQLTISPKGTLWLGRKNGTYSFHRDTLFGSPPVDGAWLGSDTFAVATASTGIEIVTGGIHHRYNMAHGLASDLVQRMYYTAPYLWACTSNGLTRLTLDRNARVTRYVTLSSRNLLLSDEVRDIAFDSGLVYVATAKGISVVSTGEIDKLDYAPPVYLQHIELNENDSPLYNKLVLPYDLNNINFSFRAVSLNREKILYRYQLVGLDDRARTGSRENIAYAALPPGSYAFIAAAKTENGPWRNADAFQFTINPPVWLRWWFIAGEILLGLLLVGAAIQARTALLRRRNETKRKLVESELRALRLHMNPHFIFNSLTALHAYVMRQENAAASDYIVSFSKLIRTIMEFSSRSSITVRQEQELLQMYIELEQGRFGGNFSYKIELDSPELPSLHIPPLVIQPFVENAIKYGLSGVDNGFIGIHFSQQADHILCTVDDNGIGRTAAAFYKSPDSAQYTSTGVRYTRERLQLLFNNEHTEVVEIEDKYDDIGRASGTRVVVKLPIL